MMSSVRCTLSALAFTFLPVFSTQATESPVLLGTWGGCGEDRGIFDFCWGSDGPVEFSFPRGVTVDDQGFVYVSDSWNSRIQKLSPTGQFVAQWGNEDVGPGQVRPWAIAWGPDNVLYVANFGDNPIQKFDRDGTWLGGWGESGGDEGQLYAPEAIDFDQQGNLVVLDSDNNRVQVWTVDGVLLSSWGEWGWTQGKLWNAHALVVLPDETILIADETHGVQLFAADGTFLKKWVAIGDGDGEFNQVWGMTLGPDGNVFMVDRGNHRVQVLSPSGRYLGQWGKKGFGPGQFYGPGGVAVSGDFAYVADRINSAVHGFTWRSVIDTEPTGLLVRIDGVEQRTPIPVDWKAGSQHAVEALTPQDEGGYRREFAEWSQGGGASHVVTATKAPERLVASFDEFYRLEMSAAADVEFSPQSQWIVPGSSVAINAAAINNDFEVRWDGTGPGSYTGPLHGATITPDGPVTQHASRNTGDPGPIYDLSISASATDPHVNVSAPTGGVRNLYLWMTCAPAGWTAFEAQTIGSIEPLGFFPLNGVLNAGTPDHLFMAVGNCPSGESVDFLMGYWVILDPGGDLCLGTPETGVFGVVECDPIDPSVTLDPELRGFSSSGAPPCMVGSNGCVAFRPDVALAAPPARSLTSFEFAPAHPNPFRVRVELSYVLPGDTDVSVHVFDVAGRLTARLQEGRQLSGAHKVAWDGRTIRGGTAPAGIYFVRLEAGSFARTRKVVYLGAK